MRPFKLLTDEQKQDIIAKARARSLRVFPDFAPPPTLLPCHPDCEHCHGRGFYTEPLPMGGNEIHPCPNVGKGESAFAVTWEKIKPVGNIMAAVNAIQSTLTIGAGFVYIHGPVGTGKTMCLKATKSDPRSGRAVLTDMIKIMDDITGAFDEERGQEELVRRIEKWIKVPTLLIDEFDRVKGTEFRAERIRQIMDRRYERALEGEGVTVMVSNQPVTYYDDYLRSRLEHGWFKIVEVKAPDLRQGQTR